MRCGQSEGVYLTKVTNSQAITSMLIEMASTRSAPEVVVYVDPSKRKKVRQNVDKIKNDTQPDAKLNQQPSAGVITMKRARFEVHKFGISGFTKEKKEEAKVKLAIKLGAKPPKNKFYNYKEYQAIKKAEKEEQLSLVKMRNELGFIKRKSQVHAGKRKQDKNKGLQCQVGKYRNGVQFIPKRLIKSVNKK